MKQNRPIYEQVAYEIACQIKDYKLIEGQKLKGRSIASAEYNVSTETVRKALNLLRDFHVITIKEKSGSEIISRDAALLFLDEYRHESIIKNNFTQVDQLLDQATQIHKTLRSELRKFEKKYNINHSSTPIQTFDYQLTPGHPMIGMSAKNVFLFELTGATLFGIVSTNTISSVPSDYILKEYDILYYSGIDSVKRKTYEYLNQLIKG